MRNAHANVKANKVSKKEILQAIEDSWFNIIKVYADDELITRKAYTKGTVAYIRHNGQKHTIQNMKHNTAGEVIFII